MKMISSYFSPIAWTRPWWRFCDVFYRFATSHPINRSAVWSVMCHSVLARSEMSSLMSPSDFGEENTTALFSKKPLSASASLAWQKQKLFVLLGIYVCVCVSVSVCVHCMCHSFNLYASVSALLNLLSLCLLILNPYSWHGTFCTGGGTCSIQGHIVVTVIDSF